MKKARWIAVGLIVVVILALLSSWLLKPGEGGEKLFAFYLPWDDSEENVVSLRRWLDKPAGSLGYVHVGQDGHLYVGGKRIRFLGVNICGGATFPEKEEAEKIASRLAKFGVNIVRFHHMDASWETFNIFDRTFGNTRHLNKEALDRLDYFVAQLKENGIYVDLNLLVSRRFSSADGLLTEIDAVDWKDQQVLGFFVDQVTELEKEYARQLLTHRNPYTGLTYAEDPAVAFVETVNEQGLLHGWLGGVVDRLPEVFKQRLAEGWNNHLKMRYGSTAELAQAWDGEEERIPEVEFLENGFFEAGLDGWTVETHDGAVASYGIVEAPSGLKALEIQVSSVGSAGWHVQFNYPGLEVKTEENFLVTFRARADREATVSVSLKQAHEPWQDLSSAAGVELTTEWKEYEIALIASDSDENARLDISNLGATTGTYQFSSFSMKLSQGYSLREGESLEDSSIAIFALGEFGTRTIAARMDWVGFLYNLEEEYFKDMYRYAKEELGVKALVFGTIVGCSTPNIMAELDAVDTHAYWHHPAFPGVAWDSSNWYVTNEPMVNFLDDSSVSWLALKRVYGKPHLVTEYNHPAPNMYDAETAIILATYAALQDWDGLFLFDYGSKDNWDARQIRGYFDIDQHPVKMATLIPAHIIFASGGIRPAYEQVIVRLDKQKERELIARGRARAWNLPDGRYLGIGAAAPLIHRTAISVEYGPDPIESLDPQEVSIVGPIFRSDTGEVVWNVSNQEKGVLLVNASRSIAVVGFGGRRSFDFGGVLVELGDTLLDDWSVTSLTVMEGQSFTDWDRLLLIAAGYAINTGMSVSDYESGTALAFGSAGLTEVGRFNGGITCGTNWGGAPTLVEGVPMTVRIRAEQDIEVWALDNKGERTREVLVSTEGDYKTFSVGPEYRTLWYELVAQKS
ncbi:MAG: hypothetical protein AMJ46_12945 [Latescibacteria bacterium DG_63]|nr:MAG: hypothetical protein AMJ46_12945 [Latescibacteria bacterium DG_63]